MKGGKRETLVKCSRSCLTGLGSDTGLFVCLWFFRITSYDQARGLC